MKKLLLGILALLLVLGILTPALAQISSHFDMGWHLLSGGGGTRSSVNYQIDDALGQWVDGTTSSVHTRIDPGFWPAGSAPEGWHIYLPAAFMPGIG